jgi:hypothetical protein
LTVFLKQKIPFNIVQYLLAETIDLSIIRKIGLKGKQTPQQQTGVNEA